MANRDSIKVVCRVRPENKLELAGNYQRCVEHTDKDIKVTVSSHIVTCNETSVVLSHLNLNFLTLYIAGYSRQRRQ